MKKFIKNIFLSIIIAFFICVIFDYAISKYLQGTHWRKYDTWTKIVNSEFQDNDMLIFGSSRAWVQYSPMILDSILGTNSYNMGIDGSRFDRQYTRWVIYNKYGNKKPKYIIINTDYVSTLDTTNGYERDQFYPFFYDNDFTKIVFNAEKFSIYEKFIPMYRYYKYGLYNILTKDNTPCLKKGYEAQIWKWDSQKYNSIDSIKFIYNKNIQNIFEMFIQKELSNNIQLFLVMSPMYYGVKEKATQLDLMYSTYNEIANKYNVPLLDYTFCEISKDTANFYNAMHLNKRGAELFSKQLANDLTKIIK